MQDSVWKVCLYLWQCYTASVGKKFASMLQWCKLINFSMLIYLISWMIFSPVYKNVNNHYHPAVEVVVIAISAYGILIFQFLIKCYVILFKQEQRLYFGVM